MKPKIFRLLTLSTLLLVFALAQTNLLSYDDSISILTDDGFVLEIPETYVEIPIDSLKEINDAMKSMMGAKHNFKFRYGYQEDETTNDWFEFPYVLVAVIDKFGKIPVSQLNQLSQLEKVSRDIQKNLAESQNILGNLFVADNVEIYNYDKEKKLLIVTCDIFIQGFGEATAMMAMKFTEFGAITVYCYCRSENFEKREYEFLNIIQSVQVHPDDEYSSSMFGNVFTYIKHRLMRKYTGIGLFIFAFSCVIGFIQSRKR